MLSLAPAIELFLLHGWRGQGREGGPSGLLTLSFALDRQFGNLGEHKIRDRCAVHYILTSLRSWLQSPWTYWGFLPLSSSSPDAFSENIKDWVIKSNMNREFQPARLIRCETQCYESYSMVTKAHSAVWCKRSCFLDKMRIALVTNWKSCSRQ